MQEKPHIVVSDVRHAYESGDDAARGALHVLGGVSFEVQKGEVISIAGPSGAGKTTLLRVLAGLLIPSSGMIVIDGRRISGPGPDRILLFQELHLFYWKTVSEHVLFALRARGVPRSARATIVRDVLSFVGLTGFEGYYPIELSGGMRQRLALARALAAEPTVLLMDEPFGSLDTETRQQLEGDFAELLRRRGQTTIVVTHDIRQALFMSDKIVFLSHRPAIVQRIAAIPFGPSRGAGLRHESAFHDLEDKLSEMIAEKADKGHQ